MGIFMGVCVIVFAGMTSAIGLYFLSRCALRIERGHSSFFAVAKRTYPGAAIIFDSAIAIKCFGIA
jgi:amino acid permease